MEENEDITAAMAQAMGFSTFGAQTNPNKRRKFNAHADAVVAPPSTSGIPLHHNNFNREVASGSNATPLGARIRNENEIDLEEDGGEGNLASSEVRHRPTEEDERPKPQYPGASRPPRAASANSSDGTTSKAHATAREYSGRGLGAPSSVASMSRGSTSRGGRGGFRTDRRNEHGRGQEWWEDYYDPSSNVNPWEKLELANGIGPRGSWMSWEEAKR